MTPIAVSQLTSMSARWLKKTKPTAWFGCHRTRTDCRTLIATSIMQGRFIESSVTDREARLVGEMMRTLAARELSGRRSRIL